MSINITITSADNHQVLAVAMDNKWSVLAVDIVREANRIPYATITLNDGDVAKGEFPISNSDFFKPGRYIQIYFRPDDQALDKLVFAGLVITHTWEANTSQSTLTIGLKDSVYLMTQARKSRTLTNQSDNSIIDSLIGFYNDKIPHLHQNQISLNNINECKVQYNCTDWDFILEIIESKGLLISVENGEILFKEIKLSNVKVEPTHVIQFGLTEIYSVEMEANISGQFGSISSKGWDISTQDMKKTELNPDQNKLKVSPGNLESQKLAPDLLNQGHTLTSPAPLSESELESWSYATLARSRLGLIRGRISIKGTTDIKLLDTIEIKRVGKRFGDSEPAGQDNSKALVTGIRHRVTEQLGWVTDIQIGLSDEWLSSRPDVASPPAAGLIPPISGLQIGIVDKFDNSEIAKQYNDQYFVKVQIPAFQQPVNEGGQQPPYSVWARLASLDAGKQRGVYIRPEPGDEVVLGFFNEDPRQPVIIGSLYSNNHHPIPKVIDQPDANNYKKAWVTRSGLSICFDDQTKEIKLTTPKNNSISLSDNQNGITIQDQNNNIIIMNQNGITIKSEKDITLQATDNINLKGKKVITT